MKRVFPFELCLQLYSTIVLTRPPLKIGRNFPKGKGDSSSFAIHFSVPFVFWTLGLSC